MKFNRIDEWHSIIELTEFVEGWIPEEFPTDWKLISEPNLVTDDSFPANQDAVSTLTFVDDDYTYIVNRVHCYDNHEGPQLMVFILRLDKKEYSKHNGYIGFSGKTMKEAL